MAPAGAAARQGGRPRGAQDRHLHKHRRDVAHDRRHCVSLGPMEAIALVRGWRPRAWRRRRAGPVASLGSGAAWAPHSPLPRGSRMPPAASRRPLRRCPDRHAPPPAPTLSAPRPAPTQLRDRPGLLEAEGVQPAHPRGVAAGVAHLPGVTARVYVYIYTYVYTPVYLPGVTALGSGARAGRQRSGSPPRMLRSPSALREWQAQL